MRSCIARRRVLQLVCRGRRSSERESPATTQRRGGIQTLTVETVRFPYVRINL
jgi:hypothetical protein